MHTLLHSGPPTLQQATTDPHHQPTPLPETLSPSGLRLGQSLVGSLLLSPGSWWHKVLFVPSKSLFPQSCVSSGGFMVGLMVTSSKRACAIPRFAAPEPLSLRQATAHLYLCRRHSNTVLAICGGLWVLVHTRFVWALWASLAGKGFDSKHDFTPPTILLGLFLWSWMWSIFFWWDPTFSSW